TTAEILTGKPLESLYNDLRLRQAPAEGSAPIPEGCLDYVHVTGGGRANMGLLKAEKVVWPQVLLRADFGADRDRFDELLAQARRLAKDRAAGQDEMGEVLAELKKAMRACEKRLDADLKRTLGDDDHDPLDYIEGQAFLKS